jgi:hypothetical protein
MIVLNKDVGRWLLISSIVTLGAVFALGTNSKGVAADNIVQGYQSKETLEPGRLVALDKSSNRTVKVLDPNDDQHLFGVVVDPSDAPFTLNGDNVKTFVATSGNFQVLVSNIGGTIKPGDFITSSNLPGIGQKATSTQSRVLGQAESNFDGKTNVITTNNGAGIGRVFVQINIQNNPLATTSVLVPSVLKKVSDAVAGKSVPAIRVYASLGVFIFSAIVAILVLWSGVRGSLIALGRNPLSRKVIYSGMYKVILAGTAIFIIGLAGVYLLLKV